MNHLDSIGGTLLTILLFVVFKITLGQWAGIVTVLAGVSTLLLNIYRYNQDRKKK